MFRSTFPALLFAALALVVIPPSAPAQTVADANEGARLAPDPTVPGAYAFSWWGRAGRTYFIQQSDDLNLWTYLPVIEPGAGQPIQWGFTSSADKFFLRLRLSDIPTSDPFNADFDFDGVSNWDELMQNTDPFSAALDPTNGLPLDWEKFYHVPVGTDPNALAPRGDGFTYLQAFRRRLNPNDIYNGQTPTLTLVSGDNQAGAPGGFVPQPLVVSVRGNGGNPLTNMPVNFSVSQGGGTLQKTNLTPPAGSITVNTDGSGQAKLYFRLPNAPNQTSRITASAGGSGHLAQVVFTATSDNGGVSYSDPFTPSNIVATVNPDGSADVSWINHTDPAGTEPINIRFRDRNGNWITAITVPAGSNSAHIPAR